MSSLLAAVALTFGQNAPPPAFEVASIKPTAADLGSGSGVTTKTGHTIGTNVTLKRLMRSAYGIPEAQVFGGPKWADEERYDIAAKAPGPAGDHEMSVMLQQLLVERFKLVFHRETRPLPAYARIVGKKGLTAKRSEPGTPSTGSSSRKSIDATACSMARLAVKISEVLHAPVADATGIEGVFDFKLEWTPDEVQSAVFVAIGEQLGLKLEGRKMPTEVLVIDSVQKASAN